MATTVFTNTTRTIPAEVGCADNRRHKLARAGGYPDGLGGLCHILAGEGEQMTCKGKYHGTY